MSIIFSCPPPPPRSWIYSTALRTHIVNVEEWSIRLIETYSMSCNRQVLRFSSSPAICEIEWKVKCMPGLETISASMHVFMHLKYLLTTARSSYSLQLLVIYTEHFISRLIGICDDSYFNSGLILSSWASKFYFYKMRRTYSSWSHGWPTLLRRQKNKRFQKYQNRFSVTFLMWQSAETKIIIIGQKKLLAINSKIKKSSWFS